MMVSFVSNREKTREDSTTVIYIYLGFAKTSHTYEALVVINRHNTRDNGTIDSDLAAVIHKFQENISIIKELSNN
jgi:hypothetical protein